MLCVGREPIADHQVRRKLHARTPRIGRLGQRATRVLDVLIAAQRLADAVTLRAEEREAHRAADDHHISEVEEAVDHADLVGDLRAADHRHERARRVLEEP